ncbi:NADH-quinone oxidoreductase subunit C [Acetobacteraceae bacterium EV16P]|uniref:NADH-quinone oxidoreductase subunit C n=1 Tax=Sorlinia euscelidii TaxID=3081148 RepID=A0ABU7U0I4_9PROT
MTEVTERLQESPLGAFVAARSQDVVLLEEATRDGVPTFWVRRGQIHALLKSLKADGALRMLFDLTALDEREHKHRQGLPDADFTVVYHIKSFSGPLDEVRLKVPLDDNALNLPTITDIWPNANWLEREVWDLFGIVFEGHPHLTRIMTPPSWVGHPLRKDHYARATERPPYTLSEDEVFDEQEALRFDPKAWGMKRHSDNSDFMFLNLGPNHPSVHGVFRIVLQLEGEEIVDAVPDIGFHHRGAEKMAERQTWHSFIPYTDRIDYVGGVMNNFPYVLGVEKLAGITVPPRAQMMRVMLAEFFRISSHLVFYGTMVQDLGQLSPSSICSMIVSAYSASLKRSAASGCIRLSSALAAWRWISRSAGKRKCGNSSISCRSVLMNMTRWS